MQAPIKLANGNTAVQPSTTPTSDNTELEDVIKKHFVSRADDRKRIEDRILRPFNLESMSQLGIELVRFTASYSLTLPEN